jgi:glucosamine--fructose-6-phosphate aminotransferase (isomerizing)
VCGIVGYVGKERCVEVLMEGLGHLEYRGYDSAGLALQLDGRIEAIKQAGRLERLAEAVGERNGHPSGAGRGGSHPLGHARASQRGERPPPAR